ncbi:MAG: ABC transporter permease [Chloroflexota bacterium]|nr:hypothetical protein [Anaerolineales bacterium]
MSQLLGVMRHEFSMSIRRPGFWISYILLGLFYVVASVTPTVGKEEILRPDQIWPEAGHVVFMYNIFLPLLAGILAADRMQRDVRTGVHELQRSAPLSISTYVLAKYLGVLFSVLLPAFIIVFMVGALVVVRGIAPLSFFGPLLLAFLTIAVPSHAFVTAFSLACPLVMPLRVYQVLFTGYWFWGNLLSPQVFPTISDTVLNAAGQYQLQGFFGMYFDASNMETHFTAPEAVINLVVLTLCVSAALFVLDRYLHWQARRA